MLKICFVTQQYRDIQSGVGTYATYLIDALAEKGHEVTVICPISNVTWNEDVTFINISRSKVDPTWISLSHQFSKKLNHNEFDIIHFTDARESLFCQNNSTPIVGTVHDFYSAIVPNTLKWYKEHYPCDWMKRILYYNINKRLEQKALSKLVNIISVCKYTAKELSERYAIPYIYFHTIYNGIDIDDYNTIYDFYKNKRRLGDPNVLFVGGGNFQRKNLPLVMKASVDVIKEDPSAQFYVVGKDSNGSEMKKLAKSLDIDKNFSFLGYVSRRTLHELYIRSKVFVMPSLYESFAFAFLESMALGTPVIGGVNGGTTELINHGKNGFLVGPYDHLNLTRYILQLLHDKTTWNKMSTNGRKTAESFSKDIMVDNTLKFYEHCIYD